MPTVSVQTADSDIAHVHVRFRVDERETFASDGQPLQVFVCLARQVRFADASTDKLFVNILTADPDIVDEPVRFHFGVDKNRLNCAPKFP